MPPRAAHLDDDTPCHWKWLCLSAPRLHLGEWRSSRPPHLGTPVKNLLEAELSLYSVSGCATLSECATLEWPLPTVCTLYGHDA